MFVLFFKDIYCYLNLFTAKTNLYLSVIVNEVTSQSKIWEQISSSNEASITGPVLKTQNSILHEQNGHNVSSS